MSDRQRPALIAGWVFLLGTVAALVVALQWKRANDALLAQRFDSVARQAGAGIDERMHRYEYLLRSARGVVVAQRAGQTLSREQFRAYAATRDFDREFPGARGMGVIRRVPAAAEASFIQTARADGWPDFAIHSFAPHDGERFVIQYVEPVDRNRQAIGLDIASEAKRRAAAVAAMRSGQATLTAPITLVQASGKAAKSFLLLLPIYSVGAAPASDDERAARTTGWSYTPLIIDDVLATLDTAGGAFTLHIHDVTDAQAQTFFSSPEADRAAAQGLAHRERLSLFGRQWEAEFRATPQFVADQHLIDPRAVAGIGMAMALVLALFTRASVWSRKRDAQVLAEQARHASMLACSGDAIVGQDTEGRITDWNAAAERLFGHAAKAVIGRTVEEVLVPEDCLQEDRNLRAAAAAGATPTPIDTNRIGADGRRIDVSISMSAIRDGRGNCVGFMKALRDISEARRADRLLRELNSQLEDHVRERTAELERARHDLQSILDAVPSMIGYWDRDLRNHVANRAYMSWFNVSPEALRGESMAEMLGPKLYEHSRPYIDGVLRGEAQTFERAMPTPDGTGTRHALVHYLPDIVAGEVRGFYALVHDVTELTQSRQALAAANRSQQALLGTLHQHSIVSVADRRGRIVEANDNFCRISGYAREELLGQNHRILNSGHHPRAFWIEMWQTIADGRSWQGEVCNRAKDGSLYWVQSIIAPFVDEDGRIEKIVSIRHDLTARKQAELALAHERDLMNALLETVPDQIYFKDRDSRFLRINPGLAARYGLSDPRDAVGRSDADFFTAEHAACTAATERAIVASGEPVINLEELETWPDRPPTWNLTTKMPLRDAQGEVIGTFGISRDITQRKNVEAELAETNARFALAADAAGIGVWTFDPLAHSFGWDAWMLRHHGLAGDGSSFAHDAWLRLVHPEDRARVEAELGAALAHGAPYDTEYRVIRPDGVQRHLRSAAKLQHDAIGCVLGLVGITLDITAGKESERQLIDTTALLRNVLDAASETSIIAVDLNGLVSVFNRGAERLLGYRAEEVVARRSSLDFHDPDELLRRARELSGQTGRRVRTGLALVDAAALGVPHEWSFVRKDGSRAAVLLTITELRSGERHLGYLGVAQDISQQKALESSLRDALHDARRANEAKSQFLANVSHEIRTPLNAVLGLTQLLECTVLDSEQSDLVRKVRLGGRALLGVINDVLDLSKIDAGELHLEQADFNVRNLLADLHALLWVQANDKQLRFNLRLADDLPAGVQGDALRLQQIVTNLVTNAIKFTERGEVDLVAELVHGDEQTARLRFTVRDDGIGISPAAQARLFQPFSQADASTTRRFGGTGLGLSIVKRLVTLMHGAIAVHSEPGAGSTFAVEIPFQRSTLADVADEPTQADAYGSLAGLRVLVVDDAEINLEVARRLLERHGAQVTLAADGSQALEHLRRQPDAVDAVLMDVHMPGIDGIDATRQIRGEMGMARLPVIALTAGALASERAAAIESGMNDFVTKPFDAADLVRKLRRHATAPVAAAVSASVRAPVSAPLPAPVMAPQPSARATRLSPHWPRVAEIDAEDAFLRMGGDAVLFRRLLKGLLGEFSDDAVLGLQTGSPVRAATLHKLRGVAGNLGAKALAAAVGRAEAACRADDETTAGAAIREAAALLQRLRTAASPVLSRDAEDAPRAEPARHVAGSVDAALGRDQLQRLRASLAERDLHAMQLFESLSGTLRARGGPAAFAQLQACMDSLRFDDALQVLDQQFGMAVGASAETSGAATHDPFPTP